MGSLYLVDPLEGFKGKQLGVQDQFHSPIPRARVFANRRCRMAKPKLRDNPDLSAHATPGARISVRVTPSAAQDSVAVDKGTICIAVTAPPENGKANDAVRRVLAVAMGVAPSRLTLKQGQASRDKLFVYAP